MHRPYRSAIALACFLSSVALAGTTANVTPGPYELDPAPVALPDAATLDACTAAAQAAGPGTYTCRTSATVVVSAVTAPPPPTCSTPQPADDTQSVSCPSGTTGTWSKTRSYTATSYPTCWTAGAWSPSAAPAGACTAVIVAPPPPTSDCAVDYADLTAAAPGQFVTVFGPGISGDVSVGGKAQPTVWSGAARRAGMTAIAFRSDGSAGAISVGSCSSALQLAAGTGNVWYVALTGSDSTCVAGDETKPCRSLQTTIGKAKPGDQLILRGGEWRDVGTDKRWARLLTGGNLSIATYPGEDVHYSGNPGGGIQGPDSAHAGKAPNVTISGLRIEGTAKAQSDGAPINLQYGSNGWRVVNNDLSWSAATSGMKAAGVVGHGNGVAILGNAIHDIAGGSENHGLYLDGGAGYEIAYNLIARVTGGNLFQTYDTWDSAGTSGVSLHNNELTDGARYGVNIADGTVSVDAYANTITNTALAGVRVSVDASQAVNLYLHQNVLTNVNTTGSPSSDGAVNCDWKLTNAVRALFESNTVAAGKGASEYYEEYGSCPALKFSGNTWSGLKGKTGP